MYPDNLTLVRGYHHHQRLTDERFISNPFTNGANDRMYRTGDLACYREDGTIDYLGRIDHQIKIRGYRIELGEIESLLLKQDSVGEAVVLLREDTEGDKRFQKLIYFYTSSTKYKYHVQLSHTVYLVGDCKLKSESMLGEHLLIFFLPRKMVHLRFTRCSPPPMIHPLEF